MIDSFPYIDRVFANSHGKDATFFSGGGLHLVMELLLSEVACMLKDSLTVHCLLP